MHQYMRKLILHQYSNHEVPNQKWRKVMICRENKVIKSGSILEINLKSNLTVVGEWMEQVLRGWHQPTKWNHPKQKWLLVWRILNRIANPKLVLWLHKQRHSQWKQIPFEWVLNWTKIVNYESLKDNIYV